MMAKKAFKFNSAIKALLKSYTSSNGTVFEFFNTLYVAIINYIII